MLWRRGFVLALGVGALVFGACQAAKDKIEGEVFGDPVPSGMGVSAATAATAGVAAGLFVVNEAIVPSPSTPLKPGGSLFLGVGEFPERTSITCDNTGGNVNLSGQAPGTVSAQFVNCANGPYSVNGSATLTFPEGVKTCFEDLDESSPTHQVPRRMVAAFSNTTTVSVGDFATRLTGFSLDLTQPAYNGGLDRPQDGGTCSLVDVRIHAQGELSNDLVTIDLGSTSLNIDVADQGENTTVTINDVSHLTFKAPCTDGPVGITLHTPLGFPLTFRNDGGDGTPVSGTLHVTPDGGDTQTVVFPSEGFSAEPCTGPG
ncbi:MAG: hypothetical protein ACOYXR_06480 [Nitrospirota bacterium]